MSERKLDFSAFHPLDHRIGSRSCRHVRNFPDAPQGWGNLWIHAKYWHQFKSPWATRRTLRRFRAAPPRARHDRGHDETL